MPARPRSPIVVDTGYIRPRMAASHLLVEAGEAAFIDTGPAPANGHLLAALHDAGLAPEAVRYVILTHIHLDHAGGAAALLDACPGATLLVHPRGAGHMIDPTRLVTASIEIFGEARFSDLYGTIGPIDPERVRTVEEGFVLDFNGRRLHFLDTPGHARHHLCVWDPAGAGLFSGDTCGMAYPALQLDPDRPFLVPATAPAAFEPDRMIDSIGRLMALGPRTLHLPHFGPVPAREDAIGALIALIEEHDALARQATLPAHEQLADTVAELLYRAYLSCRTKKREPLSSAAFRTFIEADIELNAQGIAARHARLHEDG